MACMTTVRENVCVDAQVTIRPRVDIGTVETFCLTNPVIGGCSGTLQRFCTFRVGQQICVEIPLTFTATAEASPNGIICGTPVVGTCQQELACTHTIGFWRNHPTETLALIGNSSIILGIDNQGLSFTVTAANAIAVLSFKTPSPPAPDSPPFAQQYQQLYAQLLAAQLNNLNGAECAFKEAAIAAANTFLATSPAGGKAGAPEVQEPLELFNSGNAPGCPFHCDEDDNG